MPASSISGVLSTSLYFGAVFMLLVVLLVPVVGVYGDASRRAAGALAGGVADEIDALSPGMYTTLFFGGPPWMSASVTFSGTTVRATVNGFSANHTVVWLLSPSTLAPGEPYVIHVIGGVVRIE